jgi:hypothetical protein
MMSSAIAAWKTRKDATKDELTALHSALGTGYASVQVKEVDKLAYIELTPSGRRPIDLSTVPPGKVVNLDVHVHAKVDTVKLVGLRAGCVVALTLVDRPTSQDVKTLELHDCSGQVRVVSTMRGVHLVCTTSDVVKATPEGGHTPGAEPGDANGEGASEDAHGEDDKLSVRDPGSVVLLKDVELTVAEPLTGTVLLLDGGTALLQARVDHVSVVSSGEIDDLSGTSGNRIEQLSIAWDASLTLGPDLPQIGTIAGVEGARPTLSLYPRSPDRSRNTDAVRVAHIKDVTIAATDGMVTFGGVSTVTDAAICPDIHLRLAEHSTVSQTVFVPASEDDEAERPILSAAQGAFLLDVSGAVSLAEAPGIHVAAGTDGLAVNLATLASTEDPWAGAMMTNIILPRGLVGRRVLDRLEGAYHFTPAVATLPGRDLTIFSSISTVFSRRDEQGPTTTAEDRAERRRLDEDAEFMRELSALCRKKGTPGSVATTVAWCAYRLRHLKSRGVERAALAVYRTLGYGERPLPAFGLWAVLSLVLAGPVLAAGGAHFDPAGAGTYLTEVVRLALGPLAGLLRGGTLSGGDLAEIAARAVISIPLVTGAIALRNYVKSER